MTRPRMRYIVRRAAVDIWEYLSWGPFFWMRRLTCRLRGHDWDCYHECEMDFIGRSYCRRCMEGA